LIEALAVEERIHTRSHPVDKVEYHIVEGWHRGFVEVVRRKGSEGEHRRDSVEYHIPNVRLLHQRVAPVLRKDFVAHY